MSLTALEIRCPRCALDTLHVEVKRRPAGGVSVSSDLCGYCGHHVWGLMKDESELAEALDWHLELGHEVIWFRPRGDVPWWIRGRIVGLIPIGGPRRAAVEAARWYGVTVSNKMFGAYEQDWPSWFVEWRSECSSTLHTWIAQMRHCVVLRRDDDGHIDGKR